MSLHPHHEKSTPAVDLLSAIEELAENNKTRVNSRRGNNRVELNCAVRVEPANASDRGKFLLEGSCRDVSPTGGRLILNQAMLVGDVYLIHIEGDQFRLDPTFVRCIRCHLIREGDFECGISFLSSIDLQAAFDAQNGQVTSERPAAPTTPAAPAAPAAPLPPPTLTTPTAPTMPTINTSAPMMREEAPTQQLPIQPNV